MRSAAGPSAVAASISATDSRTRSCAKRNEYGSRAYGSSRPEPFQRLQPVEAGLRRRGRRRARASRGSTSRPISAAICSRSLASSSSPAIRSRTTSRTVDGTPVRAAASSVSDAAVGEEPGQLPDEERVAGGAGVDAAGGAGTGCVAGLAADELGHLGEAERAEPDPAVAGQPARRGEHPRQLRAGRGRAVAQRADDSGAARQPSRQVTEQFAARRRRPTGGRRSRAPPAAAPRPGRRAATTCSNRRNWAPLSGSTGAASGAVARLDEAAELAGEPLAPAPRRAARRAPCRPPAPTATSTVSRRLPGSGPRRRARRAGRASAAISSSRRVLPTPGSPSTMTEPRCRRRAPTRRPAAAPRVPRPGRPGRPGAGLRRRDVGGRSASAAPPAGACFSTRRWAATSAGPGSMPSSSASRARTVRNTDSASACWPAAARADDEARLHRFVQRRHPRRPGATRGSTRSGWPSDTASSAAATHASKNSASSAAKIDIAADPWASPSPAGPCQSPSARTYESSAASWPLLGATAASGRFDQLPEQDEVQHAGTGGEQVAVAAALQVRAGSRAAARARAAAAARRRTSGGC